MMKYAVNHHENFVNPHASFLAGLSNTILGWATEVLMILVLTKKKTPVEVVLAYTAFQPISYAPVYYFKTLVNHKITSYKKWERVVQGALSRGSCQERFFG